LRVRAKLRLEALHRVLFFERALLLESAKVGQPYLLAFPFLPGMGWITDPKRAAYNKVYNKTSRGCSVVWVVGVGVLYALFKLGF
jgi:hypothetical protein